MNGRTGLTWSPSEPEQTTMLHLSGLNGILSQVLKPPGLHTAILLTTAGQLVSVATDPNRSKDDIYVVAGLSGEIWQETRLQEPGTVNSEVRRSVKLLGARCI